MKNVVGAQLYTVRDLCQTAVGFADTLKRLCAAGYTAVQVSGVGPIPPKEIARILSDTGMAAVATHVDWPRLRDNTDKVIAEHKMWNCRHTAIGIVPADYRNEQGLRRFVAELPPVAEKINAAGMTFSYHNHNWEMVHGSNGKNLLEILYDIAPADHLKVELDTYWIQTGGGDPVEWIRKYPNRQPLLHLKDCAGSLEFRSHVTEVGQGNLNWPAILKAAREAGVEWYLVEQDDCWGRDPVESLAMSYRYLKDLGLS